MVNVNTKESLENRCVFGARGEKIGGGDKRGVRGHGRRAAVTVGDAIMDDVHGSDRRVGVHRN